MANASTETRIQDNSHAKNCFEEFQSIWQSEQLCDLTLKVAEMEFKVHKLILVSCSKYFKNMFTQELFVEKNKNCVELRQVDPNAFRIILEYFYSGYVVLSENTVERVLATADFFSLKTVKSICGEYLMQNVDINNCIPRYCMGVTFGLDELECQTKSFIMDKLDEISKTSNFHKTDKDILKGLLKTTEPNANGEQIYTAVMDWVKYDFDNRKHFLSDLLDSVPTENISHDFYLDNMKNATILRQDYKCLHWLLDNVVDKFGKLNVCSSCLETKLFITSRSDDKSDCFQLQLKTDKHIVSPLPVRPDIAVFSAITYKKSIYITAGEYGDRDLEKSYKYDTHKNSWSEINLNFERHSASACILRDQLFIVGGYNYRRKCNLNSCISYDFNSYQKVVLPEMKESKCLPGMSVYQNSIYVCCGRNGRASSLIERYDPREGLWQNVGKCKIVSGYCSSAVVSDYLYTSERHDAVCERFDFRNNSSDICKISAVGSSNWITSSEGKLFRVHETGLSEYDVNNNQWLTKECNFNLASPTVVPWDST